LLDDQLLSGPDNDYARRSFRQFARQGWYVKQNRLVIGDRAPGDG